jgi:hypothetical protein
MFAYELDALRRCTLRESRGKSGANAGPDVFGPDGAVHGLNHGCQCLVV